MYEAKLSACELFDHPPYSETFKQMGEMLITSHPFEEYHDCVQDCYEMFNEIAARLQTVTEKQYVVATKINPLHDPAHDGSPVIEDWAPEMILKMYLAEAIPLREDKVIKSTVSSTISVIQEVNLAQRWKPH